MDMEQIKSMMKKPSARFWMACIVMIVVLVPRIGMIGTLPMWDGGEYYSNLVYAVQNFDFTWSSFWTNFRLCGHPTLAFGLFSMIGELLFPGKAVGVQLIALFLTVIAMLCLWDLLQDFFAGMDDIQAGIIIVLCSFVPLFLGTFSDYYPDYYIFIFLIFLIHAYDKKHYILQIIWGICLAQTKETGMLFLLVWAVYIAAKTFISTKGRIPEKFRAEFTYLPNYCSLLSGCTVIVYLIYNKGISSWQPSEMEATPYWGIDSVHIVTELKELFLVNFIWLIWIGIIGCVVCLLIQKKFYVMKKCAFLFILSFVYVIFCMTYVTSAVYRYHVTFVLLSTLLFGVLLHETLHTLVFYYAAIGVIGLLYIGQTFQSIDPVTNHAFDTYEIGNGKKMVSIGKSMDYYSDNIVYNFQYTWIDRSVNKVMQDEYDENTWIVSQKESLQLGGNEAAQNYILYWDNVDKKRTFLSNSDSVDIHYLAYENPSGINILNMSSLSVEDLMSTMQEKIVILHYPDAKEGYTDGFYNYLDSFYLHTQTKTVHDLGELSYDVYQLKDKDAVRDELSRYLEAYQTENQNGELLPEYYCDPQAEIRQINSDRNVTQAGDIVVLQCSYICNNDDRDISEIKEKDWAGTAILEAQIQLGNRQFMNFIHENLIGKKCGDELVLQHQYSDYDIINPFFAGRKIVFKFKITDILGEI